MDQGKHSYALHAAHQQIAPGRQGNMQGPLYDDTLDDNGWKTGHPSLSLKPPDSHHTIQEGEGIPM